MGIGKGRGKYCLETVFSQSSDNYTEIYNSKDKVLANKYKIINYQTIEEECKNYKDINRVSLNFLTPVRIKHNNKLTDKLEFYIFLSALLRRLSLLSYFHCDQELDINIKKIIEDAKEIKVKESNLKWYDWERYSQRQDTKMKLGGLVGDITFEGNIMPFLPFLILGKYIHVGKSSSFGLGRYEIKIES